MKLYVASLHHIGVDTTLVGVYSDAAKAINAGEHAIYEMIDREPMMLDWDYEQPESRYYFDGFTLMVTEATLDQTI